MKKSTFVMLEKYMYACMEDASHDREHVYRVLYTAMDIAETEPGVDKDVLIAACLLHDIGRKEQFADPSLCHAHVGGDKAYAFLVANGFSTAFAEHVRACIQTHRFRTDQPPVSIEAEILFDADKIDVSGAIGIARTLIYVGQVGETLYYAEDGTVFNGENDPEHTFFTEYHYKLKKIYSGFFTQRGREIAAERKKNAEEYYDSLYREIVGAYIPGYTLLKGYLDQQLE